jgi:rubrerythrin
MLESAHESAPTPGAESVFAAARLSYIADADDRIGSVPPPPTVKGVVKTGARKLTGKRPQVFMDKLGERLAFERTGVRLYEALIVKHTAKAGDVGSVTAQKLREIRDEESSHFALLTECVESLGADPTVQTPCADLAAIESEGLIKVVTDARTTFTQSLHAILVAELTDNASWEMLISLAEAEGQPDMATRFREAWQREQDHLETVRSWLEELTLGEAAVDAAAGPEIH